MNKSKKNITKKIGGHIHKRKVFENILSIGYELETSSLSKLTLISQETDLGESILLNTDTARKDIEVFQKKSEEGEDYAEENEDWIMRQEEEVEFDVYDNNNKIDKNVSFLVTNDIVESPFVKKISKTCEQIENEMKVVLDKFVKTDVKNNLYEFHDKNGKKYHFNFVFHEEDEKTFCGVFSDVEWIFTYYKPKSSGNIIIETFANAIKNLLIHVKDLIPINGSFVINNCKSSFEGGNNSLLKSKEVSNKEVSNKELSKAKIKELSKRVSKELSNKGLPKELLKELSKVKELFKARSKELSKKQKCTQIVKKPEIRTLFNLPNTNLHYLQTHYYDKELQIGDICITPQMTFSAYVYNIIPIMKQMLNDNIKSIPDTTSILEHRLDILNNIEYFVNTLLEEYNKTEETFKILSSNSKTQILYKTIKSYIFLIMYKLFMFYNFYLEDDNMKYFKDALFFNSRHSNYIFYKSLKKSILLYFESLSTPIPISELECISIIQKIIVQQKILENKFVKKDNMKIRRNAFNIKNKLDKNASSYGNPAKSLISYLQHFEDPINVSFTNDWLEYKEIDAFSSKMDLNSDIVLMEFRTFTRLLSSYIYHIANKKTKQNMTHGICNQMAKNFKPDIKGISLSVLSDFYDYVSTHKSLAKSSKKNISRKSNSNKNI